MREIIENIQYTLKIIRKILESEVLLSSDFFNYQCFPMICLNFSFAQKTSKIFTNQVTSSFPLELVTDNMKLKHGIGLPRFYFFIESEFWNPQDTIRIAFAEKTVGSAFWKEHLYLVTISSGGIGGK